MNATFESFLFPHSRPDDPSSPECDRFIIQLLCSGAMGYGGYRVTSFQLEYRQVNPFDHTGYLRSLSCTTLRSRGLQKEPGIVLQLVTNGSFSHIEMLRDLFCLAPSIDKHPCRTRYLVPRTYTHAPSLNRVIFQPVHWSRGTVGRTGQAIMMETEMTEMNWFWQRFWQTVAQNRMTIQAVHQTTA